MQRTGQGGFTGEGTVASGFEDKEEETRQKGQKEEALSGQAVRPCMGQMSAVSSAISEAQRILPEPQEDKQHYLK